VWTSLAAPSAVPGGNVSTVCPNVASLTARAAYDGQWTGPFRLLHGRLYFGGDLSRRSLTGAATRSGISSEDHRVTFTWRWGVQISAGKAKNAEIAKLKEP
jgi:hypothetical protein